MKYNMNNSAYREHMAKVPHMSCYDTRTHCRSAWIRGHV